MDTPKIAFPDMIIAEALDGELDRLAALHALSKLDTPREERFDRLTRQVSRLLDMPIAYLSPAPASASASTS
jgi:hypothetical protein